MSRAPRTRKKTDAAWLALMVFGAGCECDRDAATGSTESASTTPSTTPERPPTGVGVTAEGESIIFGGTARPERPSYDPAHVIREPNAPDPEAGDFTLDEAVEGMPTDGQLVAEIGTQFGTMFCDLYADRVPHAVANFIGLARGRRPWWDARAGQWVRRPYYRGTTFHRVIPGYIVQGGDYLGDGSGSVGYTMPYEPHETLSHDRAGRLALASVGDDPATGGAQFYITDGPAPQLDGHATIFGQCMPVEIVSQIARLPQSGEPDYRPLTPYPLERIFIRRVPGGAAAATPTPPRRPEGEPEVGRGASPSPSELQGVFEGRRPGLEDLPGPAPAELLNPEQRRAFEESLRRRSVPPPQ